MKGKSPMMKALIGKQNNLPAELKAKIEASPAKMKKKSPAKMKKASPAKEVTKSGKINPFSAEYKSMTKSQRTKKYGDKKLQGSDKRQIGGPEGRLDLELKHQLESGMFAKIKKAAGNVSRVIKGENKDGTSKGGLVIKSKKDETTGKRSTTISRKNNTDKKGGATPPPAINPPPANNPPPKGKVTYKQAWDKMSAKAKKGYKDFAAFKTAAEDYNDKKKK